MFPDFDYVKPLNLKEALAAVHIMGDRCRLLAGGTALMVDLHDHKVSPELLVDISELDALRFIETDGRTIRIGAATTLTEIAESCLLNEEVHLVAAAAASVGGPQVRNRGTIGGNLLYASPGADMAPSLLALAATLKLASEAGEREVPIDEFFVGPRRTACRCDEILTEICLHSHKPGRGTFIKLGLRNAMAISLASVGVWVETDHPGDVIQEARVALGAVAPTPVRARAVEDLLRGERASSKLIKQAALAAQTHVQARSNSIRSSAEYRRAATSAIVQRALEEVFA